MIYTIYQRSPLLAASQTGPTDGLEDAGFDHVVAVPEGNAKWALIFPPIWLAWHRLWFALVIYTSAAIFLAALLATPLAPIALILGGLPGIFLFLEGNQLRRNRLEALGWVMVDVKDATDAHSAIERFLHTYQPPKSAGKMAPPARGLRPSFDREIESFGMFPQGES